MNKFLTIIGVVLLTLTSCSKDSMETVDIAGPQPDLTITGSWATNTQNTNLGIDYYGLNFGNGITDGSQVDGYFQFIGDTCATYDGYWVVTNLTATSVTLSAGSSSITLTFVNSSTFNVNANIEGETITGTLTAVSFYTCS